MPCKLSWLRIVFTSWGNISWLHREPGSFIIGLLISKTACNCYGTSGVFFLKMHFRNININFRTGLDHDFLCPMVRTCTNCDQLSEILYQRLSASTLYRPARVECPWTRLDDTTAPVLGSIRSMAYFAIWLSDSRHVFYGIGDVTLDTRSTACLLLVRGWMVRGTANCFGECFCPYLYSD